MRGMEVGDQRALAARMSARHDDVHVSDPGDEQVGDREDREAREGADEGAVQADVLQVAADHELDLLGRLDRSHRSTVSVMIDAMS